MAGLANVLPKNIWLYVSQIPNLAALGTNFVLQGGTQHNLAAVKAQVDFIESRFAGKDAKGALSLLKQQLAVSDQSIPTLYRQYVDLCEPDGVRFLAFGVDPQFGGCVDGLIRPDLTRLKAAKRARYLSEPDASSE